MSIISIVFAITIVLIIIFTGFKTNILRETSTFNTSTPYSFSKFQLWLWTIIICPAFIINWGFGVSNNPDLNNTALILLSISMSSTVTASFISAPERNNDQTNLQNNLNHNIMLKSERKSISFISDILMDDSGQFSLGRLQNLIFTFVYVFIYISIFFKSGFKFPEFETNAFILQGISSGGYILGKSMKK